MTSMVEIMTEMGEVLKTISKLHVGVFGATGQINTPHAIVGIPTIENFRTAYAGPRMNLSPTVTILTSAAFDQIGNARLATFVAATGETSVFEAFERNPTLNGVVERCRVTSFRPLSAEEFGAIGYFGGEFTFEVMARG